jgi:hypothetical protein
MCFCAAIKSTRPTTCIGPMSAMIAITTPISTWRSASSGMRWKLMAEKARP